LWVAKEAAGGNQRKSAEKHWRKGKTIQQKQCLAFWGNRTLKLPVRTGVYSFAQAGSASCGVGLAEEQQIFLPGAVSVHTWGLLTGCPAGYLGTSLIKSWFFLMFRFVAWLVAKNPRDRGFIFVKQLSLIPGPSAVWKKSRRVTADYV
jgi:hypothetical protein